MRIAVFLVGLLLATPAVAQSKLLQAHRSSYTGPGDSVSSALYYYSCASAYTAAWASAGNLACNIRRASDNEACDFPFVTNGGLGLSKNCVDVGLSVTSFLTSTTGFVTKAYDQAGSAVDVSQGIAGNQPALTLNDINGFATITGNGSTTGLFGTAGGSTAQPFSDYAVAKRTGAFTSAGDILSTCAANNSCAAIELLTYNTSTNTIDGYAGTVFTATVSDSAFHTLQWIANGASSTIVVDGTTTSGNSNTRSALPYVGIGSTSQGGNQQFLTGSVAGVGKWPVGFNSTQYNALCHFDTTRYALGLSC